MNKLNLRSNLLRLNYIHVFAPLHSHVWWSPGGPRPGGAGREAVLAAGRAGDPRQRPRLRHPPAAAYC